MKKLFKRRTIRESVPAVPAEPEENWAVDSEESETADAGGWSTGARANASALMRWAAWALLVAGPLIGLAALVSVPAGAGATRPSRPPAAPAAAGGQGAAGFASRFVAAFIQAGEGDQDKLAAFYPPAAELRLEGKPGRQQADQLTVARLRETDPGVWSVTIAARITADSAKAAKSPGGTPSSKAAPPEPVRYFQVPVASAPAIGGATGYVALGMPADVAPVDRIKTPKLIYGPMRPALPTDPRTQAVAEFLTAYLTGSGELYRYLAPGTRLTPISPAPYTAVAVDQLAVEGEQSAQPTTDVPADGTRLRLVAAVRAAGADSVRVPLTYALSLSARGGRWEIAALDGAPAPAPLTTSNASPTT